MIDKVVAVGAGIGLVCSAVVAATTFISRRPFAVALAPVALLAIPLVIGGQLWAICVQNSRLPARNGRTRKQWMADIRAQRRQSGYLAGGLPKAAGYAVKVVCLVGWLMAMSTFVSGPGDPMPGSKDCPWPVRTSGWFKCVSHATYLQAKAAPELGASAVLTMFFAMHLGVAAGELASRRQAASRVPADPGV